jgi:hypothetical protein
MHMVNLTVPEPVLEQTGLGKGDAQLGDGHPVAPGQARHQPPSRGPAGQRGQQGSQERSHRRIQQQPCTVQFLEIPRVDQFLRR